MVLFVAIGSALRGCALLVRSLMQFAFPVSAQRHYFAHCSTYELCAGLLNKGESVSLEQHAVEEVAEECGYSVAAASLRPLFRMREAVGIVGTTIHVFYVQVDDSQKVSAPSFSIVWHNAGTSAKMRNVSYLQAAMLYFAPRLGIAALCNAP